MFLIPQAWAIFPFYSILLFLLVGIAKKYGIKLKHSLPMGIYFIYAISVLWEIPIQYGILQNPDALMLSIFKVAGVPFFFYWLYERGWKVRPELIINLVLVSLVGAFLATRINYETIQISQLFWAAHSYRLFWIYLLGLELILLLRRNVIYSSDK